MSFKNGGYWPYLLGGLLLSGVVMNIAMVLRAADDPSFAIEEDYYQKAVNWDEQREELRKSKALGWTLIVEPTLGEKSLTVRAELRDSLGREIPDATLELEALHLARANQKLRAVMDRDSRGFYATLPANRVGTWELAFEAVRGEQRFVHTERAELYR